MNAAKQAAKRAADMARVNEIVRRLKDLFAPNDADRWLRAKNHALDNKRPMDLFGDEEGERKMIAALVKIAKGRPTRR